MKRRALIIGSPLDGRNFLAGVEDDVNNVYRYLTSSIGGGYDNNEVAYLNNPSKSSVLQAKNWLAGSEMAIVYFSGHGCQQGSTDYVWLNHREYFPVASFLTSSKRNIIITDACRTPLDTRGYGDVISGIGFHFSKDNLELSRRLYWEYLLNSPTGNAIVFSTSDGMPSSDSESGGVFTKSLMTVLRNWSCTERQKTITLNQIFHRSVKVTREYEPYQEPMLKYQQFSNIIHSPFAINPEAHLSTYGAQRSIGNTWYSSRW